MPGLDRCLAAGLVGVVMCGHTLPVCAEEEQRESPALLAESAVVERAVIFVERRHANGELGNGFYIDYWNMIPGAGWISGGPGYRQWYARDRVFFDASSAISWRGYKTAQARLELPKLVRSRVALGTDVRWQDFTQVSYFGEGAGSARSDRSEYRIQSRNLVAHATARPTRSLAIGGQVGWLKPSIHSRTGWFERDHPDTRDVFPDDPVFRVSSQPTFIHTEASILSDTRDFPRHPSRGHMYRAAIGHYADRDGGAFSFNRTELEAAQFLPLAGSRVVVALHGWLVASEAVDGQSAPFYLQTSLGGHNSLRSYADYRFHDSNLLVVNVESRLAMTSYVDAAVFLDAGNVAPRLGDLDLDKRSYGVGLRLHSRSLTLARFDVAHGQEGWRVLFRLSDPLDLSRLSRRTAAVPFVP